MLLDNPIKRQKQVEKTADKILKSMRHTVPYIDINTASKVLRFTYPGSLKTLRRMCTMKLLREHKVITKKNQKMSVFVATKNAREFMPEIWRSKIWTMKNWRLANHNHDMNLHLLFWDLEAFATERGLGEIEPKKIRTKKNGRRSDFDLEIGRKTYKIELELTSKSRSRYEKILTTCSYEFSENPFVWVFTKPELLKKVFLIAQELEIEERMEFVLWIPEENQIKPVPQHITPLFGELQEPEENTEVKTNDHETYTTEDLEMELQSQREQIYGSVRRFMSKLANMNKLQQIKYLNEVKKQGFSINHLD